MAGYIVTMNSELAMREAVALGVYGTLMTKPTGRWKSHHEGTFADFATMREGDNIYFFVKRKLYGIGRLRSVGGEVAHGNSPNAHVPEPFDPDDHLLIPSSDLDREIRWFCTFGPYPAFFDDGIDMDDLLESAPSSFRMLRVLWKRSFVKVDHIENQALKNMFLQRAHGGFGTVDSAPTIESDPSATHAELEERLSPYHRLSSAELLASCSDGSHLTHEMALEAGLLRQLAIEDANTTHHLGHWDYLSHQVPASPFKPVDYMDFIDLFGYRFVPDHEPTVAQFFVAELKRGTGTGADVLQLMKYVDWVRAEYAAGDYGLVSAFLIAHTFDESASAAATVHGQRRFITGRRPPVPRTWSNLRLLRYSFSPDGRVDILAHG